MKLKNKWMLMPVLLLVFVVSLGTVSHAQAVNSKPVADEMFGGSGITWVMKQNYARAVLTISRPDGTVMRRTFASGNSPAVDLASIMGERMVEGSYIYELRIIPSDSPIRRGDGKETSSSLFQREQHEEDNRVQSGSFLINNGYIVNSTIQENSTRANSISRTSGIQDPGGPLDQVIADDLIVQGSGCIGLDCVNGEDFSFDTVRLKENNLRIKFDDTSSSAGFPFNDWQLTANDSASGGANKFSIEDITGAKVPFTLTAGAPTNSIFVNSSGRLGLKTATPVLDIHVSTGNTPGLRFEQNGSGGFTPQTWDIAGNEANFFIRDVTGGSRLPFRIRPGAPTSSIDIAADGKVGIGTASPSYALHIYRTGINAAAVCTRSDGAQSFFNATTTAGQFGTTTNHPVKILVNTAEQMTLNSNSSITMANGASLTAGGTWTNASSRALKENIQDLSSSEAVNTLNQLNAVKYNYKVDKEEKHVGFIAEDAPELVATKDKKGMSPMDVVAILTKVVQEQQKSLQEQQKTLLEQQQVIQELQKRIDSIEKK